MSSTITSTVSGMKTAEGALAAQIHAAADMVATVGTGVVQSALDRLRSECAQAKARLQGARTDMGTELADLLADLAAFTAEIECGLTPPAVEAPEIAAPVLLPAVQEQSAEPAAPQQQEEQEEHADSRPLTEKEKRRQKEQQAKRRQIREAIEADPKASDRAIAKLVGCDGKTVASVRNEMGAEEVTAAACGPVA